MHQVTAIELGIRQAIVLYLDDLYRFAYSLEQNKTKAEDLVSETVLKAIENAVKLQDFAKIKQWMFRIMTNLFLDQKRKEKHAVILLPAIRKEKDEGISLYENIKQYSLTDHLTPEILIIEKWNKQNINLAIQAIPDVFRIAFVLCEIEEMTYYEIADTLKISVGTVRSRISRARKLLQTSLWEQAQEMGILTKGIKVKRKIECDC